MTMQPKTKTVADQDQLNELWKEFKTTQSASAQDELAQHYMPLVCRIAKRAARLVPQVVDVEDMISAGYLGLLDAMDAFDPDRGIRFSTFCSYRVRGAILDELRALDWVPRAVRHNAKQMERASSDLANRLSRKPNDEEIASELNIKTTDKMFKKMRRDAKPTDIVSIDNHNPNSREGVGSWAETIRDKHQNTPLMNALQDELKDIVARSLSQTEQLIVTLYYYEGMTMKEIGKTLDLSESRVSQVHASVLARLRDRLSHSGKVEAPASGAKNNYQQTGYEDFFKAA